MGKHIKKYSLILILVVVALFVMECPIQAITGIPCPGCMMTTALYYFIQFDFKSAYYFNPAIYLLLIMFIPLAYSYYRNKSLFNKLLWVILVLWGMIYLYRMITIFPEFPMVYVEENVISKMRGIYESIINKW